VQMEISCQYQFLRTRYLGISLSECDDGQVFGNEAREGMEPSNMFEKRDSISKNLRLDLWGS